MHETHSATDSKTLLTVMEKSTGDVETDRGGGEEGKSSYFFNSSLFHLTVP
jgi:hypothetical protein